MAVPDLGKMVGPLPLGVWLAAVGGSLGIAYLARRRDKAAAGPTVVGQPGYPENLAPLGDPLIQGPFGLPPAPGGPPSNPPIMDNTDWERAALIALVGRNYDPYLVQQTLRKYLDGQHALTLQERAIIEAAIRYVGPPPLPPNLAPPAQPLPPATPVTPAQPAGVEWVLFAEQRSKALVGGATSVAWHTPGPGARIVERRRLPAGQLPAPMRFSRGDEDFEWRRG